jgi:hypothetical protein
VVKYRNSDGVVVLKLTDDVLCFKFKTDQRAALVHVAQINAVLLAALCSTDKAVVPDAPAADASLTQ